jgi:TP901 family phage tail tape measure protein
VGQREAGIKLTLQAGGFSSGLKGAEGEVKASASRMGGALKSALSDGLKGAKNAVTSLGSTIKSTLLTAGGIGGAVGFGELVHGAIQFEGAMRRLAFQMNIGATKLHDFRAVAGEVRQVALDTGQATEDLGKVMQGVFTETGDADFARNTIKTIATAASGAHAPVEQLGNIAGTLNEKFGITEGQLGGALAKVVELGSKGGISIEDMSEKLGLVGAAAKEAGLGGEEGLGKVIALMNLADNSTGSLKKGIAGVSGILEALGTKSSRLKIAAQLGIDPGKLKGDAQAQIETILKATKGSKEKLEIAFGGEQLKILADLGKTYSATFAATGGDVKTKTAAATEAVREAFTAAGKTTLTFADLQKEAASEMKTTEKQFQVALEKLKETFSKPEISEAINQLVGSLPALADMVGKVVGFAVEHPKTAGALAIGGVAAKGFAEAAIPTLIMKAFSSGGTGAAAAIQGAMATGGSSAASGFSSALALGGPFALAIGAAIAVAFVASAVAKADEEREKDKADQEAAGKRFEEGGGGTEGTNAESGAGSVTFRDPETGELVTKTADELGSSYDSIKAEQEGKNTDASTQAARDFLAPPNEDELAAARARLAPGPDTAKPKAEGRSAEDARLLADMLGNKKLRVEVTNLADLVAPGGVPGTPAPGNQPRK